jgi:hypothetical protein
MGELSDGEIREEIKSVLRGCRNRALLRAEDYEYDKEWLAAKAVKPDILPEHVAHNRNYRRKAEHYQQVLDFLETAEMPPTEEEIKLKFLNLLSQRIMSQFPMMAQLLIPAAWVRYKILNK